MCSHIFILHRTCIVAVLHVCSQGLAKWHTLLMASSRVNGFERGCERTDTGKEPQSGGEKKPGAQWYQAEEHHSAGAVAEGWIAGVRCAVARVEAESWKTRVAPPTIVVRHGSCTSSFSFGLPVIEAEPRHSM